jgi:hypothetical protein
MVGNYTQSTDPRSDTRRGANTIGVRSNQLAADAVSIRN